MKCKYCGTNLVLEDEICPHCGKINEQATAYVEEMKSYRTEYEKKQTVTGKKNVIAGRIARIVVIAIMLTVVGVMKRYIGIYSDVGTREDIRTQEISQDVERNKEKIEATLVDIEKRRAYLEMSYYELNYRLNEEFPEYYRVFTAATEYQSIYSSILNIIDGFDYYGQKTKKDWCESIASALVRWDDYVEGKFWNDPPDSPMHAGEHGAFIADAKKEIQDMVQVYFDLTDEQAAMMWDMTEVELAGILCEKCEDLYPEVK